MMQVDGKDIMDILEQFKTSGNDSVRQLLDSNKEQEKIFMDKVWALVAISG